MGFDDVKTAALVIMSLMTGCITISGFVAACVKLYKWATKPTVDNSEHLNQHDEMLARDMRRLNKLEDMVEEQSKSNKLMMGGLLQLMNHSIDGNHVKQLIEQRDELSDYLINK